MGFKYKAVAVAIMTAFLAGPVLANAPWEGPRPVNMTSEHDVLARGAEAAREIVGYQNFGSRADVRGVNWRWQGRRNPTTPLSNMNDAQLSQALTGRYHVFQGHRNTDMWNVRYYAPDGTTHFCLGYVTGRYQEYTLDRHFGRTAFGLSGILHWDRRKEGRDFDRSRDFGWPVIGDPTTGNISFYGFEGGEWRAEFGWVQEEFVEDWAKNCPSLPRSAAMNTRQGGDTIQEMARNARALRDFTVSFPNTARDPLTAEMFFWSYPPQ